MANTFQPSLPTSGPWYIDKEDCIGDSLGWINANTNYFGLCAIRNADNIINLQNSFNNISNPGTTIQCALTSFRMATFDAPATIQQVTGIPDLTITRKFTNSTILIELVGGRYQTLASGGVYTWFYVNEGNGFSLPGGGTGSESNVHEFVYGGADVNGPHNVKLQYTPQQTVSTITARVYAKRYVKAGKWHYNNSDANPQITFSISEIKA